MVISTRSQPAMPPGVAGLVVTVAGGSAGADAGGEVVCGGAITVETPGTPEVSPDTPPQATATTKSAALSRIGRP